MKRWVDDIVPLLEDDPLGTSELATHALPLDAAPRAYELFQMRDDGTTKVVFRP